MAKTVRLSPLAVFVSLLAGVELFGLLGALLAIPVGAIIQVVAKDVLEHRRAASDSASSNGAGNVTAAVPAPDPDLTRAEPPPSSPS